MCTVSIISTQADRLDRAIRLVCNRDEVRARPEALPPRVQRFGDYLTVMPIDPQGGGTWIAASDAGLAMVLLNQTPGDAARRPAPSSKLSRGLIIPSLLDSSGIEEAAARAATIEPSYFRPFRLLILDARSLVELSSDGREIQPRRFELGEEPLMFTSSGLGDHLVQQPRRELFERIFGRSRGTLARQDAFHAHQWPQQRHVSVNMSRADARTVSRTTIELSRDHARMAHVPLAPERSALTFRLDLELRESCFSRSPC
jgi:hypothetical protein